MKEYHITFVKKNTNIASGKKYEAVDAIGALIKFNDEFGDDVVFLYIASEEMFNYKY